MPAPRPKAGQLLLDVKRCGICGSDLHSRLHGDDLADALELCGYPRYMRSHQTVVMGHEIYGEVAEQGPWTSNRLKPGTPVVTVPLIRSGRQVDGLGLSVNAPGGYAEQVVVQESLTLPVPNGLHPDAAALTEPMAVAWHSVNRAEVTRRDTAIVLGCGPVGLAVISVLSARGVATVIASDYSAGRRTLARNCGADIVVDPAVESPWLAAPAAGSGFRATMPEEYNDGIDAMERMNRLPVPWWITWRALERVGATNPKRPVVFECVGVPGMLDGVLAAAPLHSRVVVVGVCMGSDTIRPSLAINKEVDLRFVVGYTPLEFRDTLHALADGSLDASHLVTGKVGLAGVPQAFTALNDPETHAKILIDPAIGSEQIATEPPLARRPEQPPLTISTDTI
ncbi:zinc-binding dehydrogenase [Streptomyces sp. NPDC005385]|uniref:zinc-binding dehydrogenase n=1 Tax=Streptomyces sp. NPDC005385 TaxID=3157039 RepID=UPI0033B8D19F